MKDLLRVLVVLGVTLGTIGCLTTSSSLERPKSPQYTLVVENQNYFAKTVRVFCQDAQVRTFRGLDMGVFSSQIPHCNGYVRVAVEYLGDDPWISESLRVDEDGVLRIVIAGLRNYNHHWITE